MSVSAQGKRSMNLLKTKQQKGEEKKKHIRFFLKASIFFGGGCFSNVITRFLLNGNNHNKGEKTNPDAHTHTVYINICV